MGAETTRGEIVATIKELLARDKIPAMVPETCAMAKLVAERCDLNSRDAARVAWRIFVDMLDATGDGPDAESRPFAAARHVFGRHEYPRGRDVTIPEADVTLRELQARFPKRFSPSLSAVDRNLSTQRKIIALIAGGYGANTDSAATRLGLNKGGPARKIAEALADRFREEASTLNPDSLIVRAVIAESDEETVTSDTSVIDADPIAPAVPGRSVRTRLKRRETLLLIGVSCAIALAAMLAMIRPWQYIEGASGETAPVRLKGSLTVSNDYDAFHTGIYSGTVQAESGDWLQFSLRVSNTSGRDIRNASLRLGLLSSTGVDGMIHDRFTYSLTDGAGQIYDVSDDGAVANLARSNECNGRVKPVAQDGSYKTGENGHWSAAATSPVHDMPSTEEGGSGSTIATYPVPNLRAGVTLAFDSDVWLSSADSTPSFESGEQHLVFFTPTAGSYPKHGVAPSPSLPRVIAMHPKEISHAMALVIDANCDTV